MNAGLIVILLLVVFAFLGMPIYLSVAIGTIVAMVSGGFPLETLAQKTFLGLNSPSLLSIPFFILAGNIMARGITQKIINTANAVVGRVQGSTGAVTVLASALFGAISGSAVATVAAIGGMTIPAMKDEGYDDGYAGALASASSLLGPLVPPSISLIVYASLTDTSVTKLFLTTATPAIVCTVAFLAYTLYYGKKMNLPKQPKRSIMEILHIFLDSIWALLMPILVLGTIFTGICTVTEAAALSCAYSAIVALLVYRTINLRGLLNIIYESAVSVAAIMVLVGFSKASAYVVTTSQLPQAFTTAITGFTSSKFVMLLIINVILLILGCLMEGNCILVMMVPLLLPLINSMGVNLLAFGVMACVNIYLGCITPPVGVSLLVGTKISGASMGKTLKAMIPFFLIGLIILILVTYIPTFCLWLPNLIG